MQRKQKEQKIKKSQSPQKAQKAQKKQGTDPVKDTKKQRMPGEWLYMAPEGLNVRQIADALGAAYETELWEAAGVLEIVLGEKNSVDIEQTQIHPKDIVTADFAAQNGCCEIFLVTFSPEIYDAAERLMRQILEQCGGLFCGDNEELTPVLRA